MNDITLQIERQIDGSVSVGNNVVFDTVVHTSGNVDYDSTAGTITIEAPGKYLINWWVATQASASTNGAVFAISSSQGDLLEGNSPVKTGEVYGVGIIEVETAPVTVSLINSSNSEFYYATQVPLKATLVITKQNSGEFGLTGPTGTFYSFSSGPFTAGSILPLTNAGSFNTSGFTINPDGTVTVNVSGTYLIDVRVQANPESTGIVSVEINNGGISAYYNSGTIFNPPASTQNGLTVISTFFNLVDGDIISIKNASLTSTLVLLNPSIFSTPNVALRIIKIA